MATAGVIIASAVGEEEPTAAAAVETAVDVYMQPIVEVGHRQHAIAVAGRAAPRMP